MRKVTAGLFHSVDGAVEAPDQWQFDSFDDELGALLGKTLAVTDTVILGRAGYEEWAAYWPNAEFDDAFKTFINAAPKHVASHPRGKAGLEQCTPHHGRTRKLCARPQDAIGR